MTISEPRGQRTIPKSKEPTARPMASGGIIRPDDTVGINHGPADYVPPRRVALDARTIRATALTIAARIHQGRGASPYRVVQDAEVLAEYLRTGVVAEDPALAEAMERFEQAVKDGRGARAYLPDFELTYTPPEPDQRGEPGMIETCWRTIRERKGRR